MRNFGSVLLGAALTTALWTSGVWGQEPAASASAESAPTPTAESTPAPTSESEKPVSTSASASDAILTLEKSASSKTPELFAELKLDEKFTRRLPNYWRFAKPTKKQTDSIYALQLEYFSEITKLKARIARLESERDARMRSVLTEKQRTALDAKLAEVEKARAAKEAEKEAAEDAETPE